MNRSPAEVLGAVRADSAACVVPRASAGRFGFMLVALGGRLEALSAERLGEMGLDGHDYTVLAILTVDGPGTQHEIAQLMGRAPGVIVAAIDQLERKGFVERHREPADRRRSRVTPTAAGRKALARADLLGDQLVAEVLTGLNPVEIAGLQKSLARGLGLVDSKTPAKA
jgi:DNA-binding MarR family transcriptional regulator